MIENQLNTIRLTWLDIERVFKRHTSHGTNYPSPIAGVRCYSDGAEVVHTGDESAALNWLAKIFGLDFDLTQRAVRLSLGNHPYPISLSLGESASIRATNYPLWTDVAYLAKGDNLQRVPMAWTNGPKLVAFHSFKGGVGRTTALMSYVAASLEAAGRNPVKLLLVDADFEAPGISFWLDEPNRPNVSFTQLLEALHYSPVNVDNTLEFFAAELRKTSLEIDGSQRELFVLPSALDIASMMDMPVRPEHLARNPEDPWQLSEHLRTLGQILGVSHVFIDLRAGLSELSSPILFDPRVEHFFVTTVAPQSVKGMSAILERLYISQSDLPYPELAKPSVIVSMLTPELRELPVYSEAEVQLMIAYPGAAEEVMSPSFEWLESNFAASLMSLRSVREAIDASRSYSSLYPESLAWAKSSLALDNTQALPPLPDPTPQAAAAKLYRLCDRVQFAEQIESDEMLVTEPLRNLGKHFSTELPNAVSIGAKGAGKTFTFLQVSRAKFWPAFLDRLSIKHQVDHAIPIFPILWSGNLGSAARAAVHDCRDQLGSLSFLEPRRKGLAEIQQKISAALKLSNQNWPAFWDSLICDQVGVPGQTLNEFNEFLGAHDCQIVLTFDGIEDIFDEPNQPEAREAVKGLLQLPNRLSELRQRHVGAIVFIRADYVQAAIKQNVAQFLARFAPFSLEWTPESFLRLSYWLFEQAGLIDENLPHAEELTVHELLEALAKLWGMKLGKPDSKEARSALWVFGALCDLKGRFQARDLVRFLKFAAEIQTTLTSRNAGWTDRVLAPASLRQAIPRCSTEKVDETTKEISVLRDWKVLLDGLDVNKRKVPFNPVDLGLTSEAQNALRELGIIYEDTDQMTTAERFYLPEIYRHGLNFTTSAAGRPKTLALLKRNLPRLPF